MNLASVVFEKVIRRGGMPLIIWSVAVLATALVFRFYNEPLDAPELVGMGFVYAIAALGGGRLYDWLTSRVGTRIGNSRGQRS